MVSTKPLSSCDPSGLRPVSSSRNRSWPWRHLPTARTSMRSACTWAVGSVHRSSPLIAAAPRRRQERRPPRCRGRRASSPRTGHRRTDRDRCGRRCERATIHRRAPGSRADRSVSSSRPRSAARPDLRPRGEGVRGRRRRRPLRHTRRREHPNQDPREPSRTVRPYRGPNVPTASDGPRSRGARTPPLGRRPSGTRAPS